jgi:hypothetical protein
VTEPLPLITVFPSPDGWRVCFHDDAEVLALFGTDTLPSGFTRLAEPELVFRETLQRNPQHRIRLIREGGITLQTDD